MKTVKLIALDLDGTLVSEDQRISFADRAAVLRAQEAGIPVVIATGRLYPSTSVWISTLNIHTPSICCNGADVRINGKCVYSEKLDPGPLKEAYRAMDVFKVKRYVYCPDKIYCTQADYDDLLFNKWGKKAIADGLVGYCKDIDEIIEATRGEAIKFVVRTPDESMHAKLQAVGGQLGYFDLVRGEAHNFEFTRRGVNKGVALQKLAEQMGISMQDVLAVGDSMNDYEMIRMAGTGVAMGNAMKEIKNVAGGITRPVWEGGVAQAITQYVFGEEGPFSAGPA